MTDLSFPDAVAARCEQSVSDVIPILSEARVPTSDSSGSPHRLRVTRLAFTGQKAGLLSDEIDFDCEFTSGLWAISSERNDAGKTSLLEIIMWCLRGQPKRLQDDVKSWLDSVALEGTVDDEAFMVAFELADGIPTGTLVCGSETRPFASDAAFKDTMSQFMMERLGFDAFTLWVDGQGTATHQWPSYSTVLYLPREAEGAVIGDMSGSGVAQRLVQLFVGIRWARTYSACQAALREAQAEGIKAEQDAIQKVATSTIKARKAELDTIKIKMAALPRGLPSDEDIAEARSNWVALIADAGNVADSQSEADRDARAARRRATRDRKRLTDYSEAALARRLFHGLDPSKCPRCSTEIGPDRKQAEKLAHSCAVCDRELDLDLDVEIDESPIEYEEADEIETVDDLQKLAADLEAVATSEEERAARLAKQASDLMEPVAAAEALVETYSQQATRVEERRALEAEAAALAAVITEFEHLANDVPDEPEAQPEDAVRVEVLQAALDEAKDRRRDGFSEVEDKVNAAILELARRFGFATLEAAKLNMAAQLRLVKGGTKTSFSRQTPGEKLRLRIAVVVALLRVAHNFGIGRHPGLLLIDSIGAEETEPGDLAEFMRELESVTSELGIQTIVASARREILTHVPPEQQVTVTGDEYLW